MVWRAAVGGGGPGTSVGLRDHEEFEGEFKRGRIALVGFSLSRRARRQVGLTGLSRHKRPPPRVEAGPLHLFHDPSLPT
jgi:hypothetical protein